MECTYVIAYFYQVSSERDRLKGASHKYRSEMVTAIDKQNQLALEVNVLKEKERSRKSIEQFGSKFSVVRPSDGKENFADYDWSQFKDDHVPPSRSKKLVKSRTSGKDPVYDTRALMQSKDDLSIKPKRSIIRRDISLSDAESESKGHLSKTSLSDIEGDVYSVMQSMNKRPRHWPKKEIKSSKKGEDSDRNDLSSSSSNANARTRFERLNVMYKRVTGDSKFPGSGADDSSEESDI
jgi:hypothetical protein